MAIRLADLYKRQGGQGFAATLSPEILDDCHSQHPPRNCRRSSAVSGCAPASGRKRRGPRPSIDEAGSFDELTALLERDSDFDLVLLDLTMPGISGFSGLTYLRAQYPSIPAAIVSASDDAGMIRRALDLGASGFISNTLRRETMRDAIANVWTATSGCPTSISVDRRSGDVAPERPAGALTPQQLRVLMMLRKACSTSRSPMSSACRRRPSRRMSRPSCNSGSTAAPRR